MELALTITHSVFLIIAFCFIPTLIWEQKSKYSMPSIITILVLCIVMFALSIIKFILEASMNQIGFAFAILLIVLWGYNIYSVASKIRRKMIQKKLEEDAEIDTFEIVYTIDPEAEEKVKQN